MEITKTAMLSVVGRANTGKSTLVNMLVGEKVAITSPKPQTTRTRIAGVLDDHGCQYVFLDTPGLHRPKSRLGENMVRVVGHTISEVDSAVVVAEPREPGEFEMELIEKIKKLNLPAILVINKIDLVEKDALLAVIAAYAALHDFNAVVPVCAKSGEGRETLLYEAEKLAIPGGRLFPEGMVTDQPERRLAAELIREKLLLFLADEVPHGIAVEIDRLEETESGVVNIDATIYCEKKSHKGIIIGKNGAMIKKVGERTRAELENFYDAKVFLTTWVKIKENWRDSANFIRSVGLDE